MCYKQTKQLGFYYNRLHMCREPSPSSGMSQSVMQRANKQRGPRWGAANMGSGKQYWSGGVEEVMWMTKKIKHEQEAKLQERG